MASEKPNIVIQTAFLGDLLLAVPLFKEIKNQFPKQKLYLVCREGLGTILKELSLVDVIYEIKKSDQNTYKKILSDLKSIQFENLFCPHQSFRSALFSFQIRAKRKVSFDQWWNAFAFNDRVPRDLNLPDAIRQLSLLSNINKEVAIHADRFSDENEISILGPVPEWSSMNIRDRVLFELPEVIRGVQKNIACVFPGSVWATKQWTVEGFTEIAQKFSENNFQVVILGSKPEFEIGEMIVSKVPGAYNLISKTSLKETLSILKKTHIVVTNDSAGQHLAALVDAPTVSVFGPTVLDLGYRPWNPKALVVENNNIPCRPCGKHGHKKCPIGTHICMKSITSDEVWSKVQELLSRYNPSH